MARFQWLRLPGISIQDDGFVDEAFRAGGPCFEKISKIQKQDCRNVIQILESRKVLAQNMGFSLGAATLIAKKEPDAFIMFRGGQFPLVVLEAGLSERESNLIQSAQLWLHGDCAAFKFVLLVIMESKSISDDHRSPRRHLSGFRGRYVV